MKLLVIGTDQNIFTAGHEAEQRINAYGRLFDELHIIIYTSPGFKKKKLQSGAMLYPTNSRFAALKLLTAVRIGKEMAKTRGINLISVENPSECGLAGLLLKRRTGLPLHIQVHTDVLSPFFRSNSWKEKLRYRLARWVLPRGDSFRVVSERIKRSLERELGIGASKVALLPIFVDRSKIDKAEILLNLHQKYLEFDFIILMVARLVREKNIPIALKAFSQLLKEFPKTGLVIVGDGPEKVRLETLCRNLNLSANVRLAGSIWGQELISCCKTADLYLLTSNFEGYSRTVVEAAAAGLPIVMTDVGVAGELIKNNETGIVVPVGDKDGLVRAIGEARVNYPRMKAMATKARELALNLPPKTWEEYLKQYQKSFMDIHILNVHSSTDLFS